MNSNKQLCDLARILLDSTCTHVASSINSEKNRFSYVRAMSRCYNLCSENNNGSDLLRMIRALEKLKRTARRDLKLRRELFLSTKGYYMLAIHQSIEVLESIYARFDKGYSHNDEYFVRSILERMRHEG